MTELVPVRAEYLFADDSGGVAHAVDLTYRPQGDGSTNSHPAFLQSHAKLFPRFLPPRVEGNHFSSESASKESVASLVGTSTDLMMILHHRLAVAAYHDPKIAGVLGWVFATGDIEEREGRFYVSSHIGHLDTKLEVVLNRVAEGLQSDSVTRAKFLVPPTDFQWLNKEWLNSQGWTLVRETDRCRLVGILGGIVEIISVSTLEEAELVAFRKPLLEGIGESDYRHAIVSSFQWLVGPGGAVLMDEVYDELPLLVGEGAGRKLTHAHKAGESPHAGWLRFCSEENKRITRARLKDLLRTRQGLIVLSDPGAGKTALLRATARSLALDPHRLPLNVHLGRWDRKYDLLDAALAELGAWTDLIRNQFRELLLRAYREGRLTMFVDGVDECPQDLLDVHADAIAGFYNATPSNHADLRIVIASRPSDMLEAFQSRFPRGALGDPCYLSVLEDGKVERVATRYLHALGAAVDGKALVEQAKQNTEAWQLAHNPLMLRSMCVLLCDAQLRLPTTSRGLLEALFKNMLGTRSRALSTDYPKIKATAISDALREAVTTIAGLMASDDSGEIELSLLSFPPELQEVAEMVGGKPGDILYNWLPESGLLTPIGQGHFCFTHRIFEEYFSARWLAKKAHQSDISQLLEWVQKHSLNPVQGWCRPSRFNMLWWVGAHLSDEAACCYVNWLINNDDVLHQGTILAARVLSVSSDETLNNCRRRVDVHIFKLIRSWGMFNVQCDSIPWGPDVGSFLARLTSRGKNSGGFLLRFLEINVHGLQCPSAQDSALRWLCAFRTTDFVVAALDRADDAFIRRALRALSSIGTAKIGAKLGVLLNHSDDRVRIAALEAVGATGEKTLTDAVLKRLHDEDAEVRVTAIDVLVQLEGAEYAGSIMRLLLDQEDRVRCAAVRGLIQLDVPVDKVELAAQLASNADWAAEPPLEALWFMGEIFHQEVERRLASGDVETCSHTITTLGMLGEKSYKNRIASMLSHPNKEVGLCAVEALGVFDAREFGPKIASLLDADAADSHSDSDEAMARRCFRYSAARVLGEFGDVGTIPRILPLIAESDDYSFYAAVEAIVALGGQKHIIGFLINEDLFDKRETFLGALHDVATADDAPKLARYLSDEDPINVMHTIEALGTTRNRKFAPDVARLFDDYPDAVWEALRSMGAWVRKAPSGD
jgi:HEAT repeat protein